MKRRIGAIIRSVGERTEGLCRKSLATWLRDEDIVTVKNVHPFLETLRKCYEVAIENQFDWFLLVDADMVMVEQWKGLFLAALTEHGDKENLWEFTLRLRDGIEGRDIDAIHVVKGAYSKELLISVDRVLDGLKPEGSVRDDMIRRTGAKRVITKQAIAYHGYEQYATDIFNRFYNRACRDSSYAKKFKIFQNLDTEDKKIAKVGWDYGIKNPDLSSLDSRNKITDMKKFGIKEKSHIRFNLSTFYKRVR
jgi:hypothetical protein